MTPNWLFGLSPDGKKETQKSDLLDRLLAAGKIVPDRELSSLVIQAEALAAAAAAKTILNLPAQLVGNPSASIDMCFRV